MSDDNSKKLIEEYSKGTRSGGDNQLRAAIGSLNAESTNKLSDVVSSLHHQIPVTISELRGTLSQQSDKIIKSNEKIANSNELYAHSLNKLTLSLVVVTAALVVVGYMQYSTVKKSIELQKIGIEAQSNRWEMEDWQRRIDKNGL